MRSTVAFAAVIASFAIGATAVPNNVFARDTCNHDNCYRAVFGTNAKQGTARASSDCSAIFTSTVVPCPVTSTFQAAATVTSYITTITATTYASTTTTTVTSTITPTPAKAKRDAATCTPSTTSANNAPAYASSCSGYARFSSVCNCQGGISRNTVTASTMTVSTTITSTATIQTLSTTVNGGVLTVTSTTSTTVPTCSSFYLQALSGSYTNYYLANGNGYAGGSAYLVPDAASGVKLTTDAAGHLNLGSYSLYAAGSNALLFYQANPGFNADIVQCTFAGGSALPRGMATCTAGARKVFIDKAVLNYDQDVVFTPPPSSSTVGDYDYVTLGAVSAC